MTRGFLLAAVLALPGAGPGAPLIGISLSGAWYDATGLNPAPYASALAHAGARVALLRRAEDLDRVDGLLLVGGGDVDPALYGGDPASASRVDRAHDESELELLRRAAARGLPVLAVCRGAQLLAVAHGGRLAPLDAAGAKRHGIAWHSLSAHEVRIAPGSALAAMGEGPRRVSSTHVQAIADPGSLRVAASSEDGVIEAVELPGRRFVVGIQWHPELEWPLESPQRVPFSLLVEASRRAIP